MSRSSRERFCWSRALRSASKAVSVALAPTARRQIAGISQRCIGFASIVGVFASGSRDNRRGALPDQETRKQAAEWHAAAECSIIYAHDAAAHGITDQQLHDG